MTAKLEIYDNANHDEYIAWVLAEHVPRIGETINILTKPRALIECTVVDVVYMLEHDRHESMTQVCIYTRPRGAP